MVFENACILAEPSRQVQTGCCSKPYTEQLTPKRNGPEGGANRRGFGEISQGNRRSHESLSKSTLTNAGKADSLAFWKGVQAEGVKSENVSE
jgi:hypothetical protein